MGVLIGVLMGVLIGVLMGVLIGGFWPIHFIFADLLLR